MEMTSKYEFYTKLLAKLKRLKDKDLELDEYITEVEFKVNHLTAALEKIPLDVQVKCTLADVSKSVDSAKATLIAFVTKVANSKTYSKYEGNLPLEARELLKAINGC